MWLVHTLMLVRYYECRRVFLACSGFRGSDTPHFLPREIARKPLSDKEFFRASRDKHWNPCGGFRVGKVFP